MTHQVKHWQSGRASVIGSFAGRLACYLIPCHGSFSLIRCLPAALFIAVCGAAIPAHLAAQPVPPPGGLVPLQAVKPASAAAVEKKAQDADDKADEELNRLIEQKFPGGAALKTDPEQQRLLKRAEQCVADGRLDLAAVLWQKVLDEAGDTLMTRDGRTYTSLSEHVEQTLAKLPDQALRTYRIAADGEAQAVISAAGVEQEEEALSTVVRRFFLSAHGDDAAFKLACLALDRHDFVGASRLLAKIVESHPDPSIPLAEIHLRQAIASSRMSDRQSAAKALAALGSSAGARPPSEIVDLVAAEVQQAAAAANVATGPAAKDWHMELGNATRTGHMTSLPGEATDRTLSELWTREFPLALAGNPNNPYGFGGMMPGVVVFSGRLPQQANQTVPISREELIASWRQAGWRPTGQLLFDGGQVYLKAPDHLAAFSSTALSDKPVWRSVWDNRYELDEMSQTMGMMAMQMGTQFSQFANGKPKTAAEVMLFGDRVHQGMSISDGVLYSLEGKRVSSAEQQAVPSSRPFQYGVTPRRTRSNWLTAYGVAGGKVRWTRTASDEDKEGTTDVGFMAAPVPCGSLLLAPVTDGGTIWLFGLDKADGRTLWKSYLCDEPQGGADPWSPITIAVDGREAYVACGCGVVFAVDAVGGAVRWAVRYQRDGKPNGMMRQMYGNNGVGLLELAGWDDDVVIPYGRALIVMASDRDALFALDRRTGAELWTTPRTSPFNTIANYCIGVSGRGLFVAGKNVVRRYDLQADGKLVWEREIDDSFGRGCVTADAVYVPVKDSILRLDALKGREVSQVGAALTSDEPVGNLFSDGEKLWVVGPGRVYAMTSLEHRLSHLAEQIAGGDAEAQLNRMRLHARQKKLEAALADLRGAYRLFREQLPPDDAAQRLFAAMNELKLSQQQPLVALEVLIAEFVTADSPPQLGKEAATKRADLIASSLSTIRQKRTKSAVAAMLSAAPLLTEDYLISAATFAIDATALQADAAALLNALRSGDVAAQLMSVRAAARLAPEDAKPPLVSLLSAADDRSRLAAARALANLNERAGVLETLVALLESENGRVRGRSHQSLRALTGQNVNFPHEGKPEERAAGVTAWKQWLSTSGATAKFDLPLTEQNVPLGRTLFVSQGQSMLIELGPDGKKRWEQRLPGPAWGCQGLSNGHRLVAVYSHSLVIEYDDNGLEVWRKDRLPGPPYTVQRLENGNTLVTCSDANQLVEIAPDGSTTTTNIQGRPISAQRLENGNTLVALQQQAKVVELDAAGKVVWEARTNNPPGHAVRLENGNTLVSMTYTRQVVEYDPTGKSILWKTEVPLTNPYAAQRLPSGTTLVADHQGLHEIEADGKKIKWHHRQPGITGLSSY